MSSLCCPRCGSPWPQPLIRCPYCGVRFPLRFGCPDLRPKLRLTPATWTNFLLPVAWGYPLWRTRALSLLSGRPFPVEEELALLKKALRPGPGEYLDLGTSAGLYGAALLKAGAERVYGLDFSPAMLLKARRAAPGLVPVLAEASQLPFRSGSLEGVAVGGSWNEFTSPERVAAEIRRVLAPGGRIFFMWTLPSGSQWQKWLERLGLRYPRLEEMEALFAGFELRLWREGSVGFVMGTKLKICDT